MASLFGFEKKSSTITTQVLILLLSSDKRNILIKESIDSENATNQLYKHHCLFYGIGYHSACRGDMQPQIVLESLSQSEFWLEASRLDASNRNQRLNTVTQRLIKGSKRHTRRLFIPLCHNFNFQSFEMIIGMHGFRMGSRASTGERTAQMRSFL